MKYWEIIADKLSAAGWSWGMTTAIDADAGELFVVNAPVRAHGHCTRADFTYHDLCNGCGLVAGGATEADM